MQKKNLLCYFICCCIILFCFVNTAAAQTLEINPSAFYIEGAYNDLVLKNIEFTNNAPISIGVTINVNSLEDIFLSSYNVTISAQSTLSLPIGFFIKKEQVGWITYSTATSEYNQLVFINFNESDIDLKIFPTTPRAGQSVVFLDMGKPLENTYGYVYVSSSAKSYYFIMNNGMGLVNLTKSDYGNAFVRINKGGKINLIEFNIEPYNASNNNSSVGPTNIVLSIDSPTTVTYGAIKDIIVNAGNSTYSNNRVLITKPSGFSYEGLTNSFGRLSIEFNEIGEWQFTVLVGTQTAIDKTICEKKIEKITLETDHPESNQDVTINVFDNAFVKVTGPDNFYKEGTENNNKFIFNAETPGEYLIKAESTSAKGELTIKIYCKPSIQIINSDDGKTVHSAIATQIYYIRLLDFNQDSITSEKEIEISCTSDPYNEPYKVPLVEDTGYWVPEKSGLYRIDFPGDDFYSSSQTILSVNNPIQENGWNLFEGWTFVILIFAVIIIIGGLWISGRFMLIKEYIKNRKQKKSYRNISEKVDKVIPH